MKKITDSDVIEFANITGDTNPLHLNEEFARQTIFWGRIAHGMLTASFISAAIGTQMPGPGCIYVSQNLRFRAPVRIGETVNAKCTITKLIKKKHSAEISTICTVSKKKVVDGNATIIVPSREKRSFIVCFFAGLLVGAHSFEKSFVSSFTSYVAGF